MKLLWMDLGVLGLTIVSLYLLSKTDKNGSGFLYAWLFGLFLGFPLVTSVVNVIVYPKWYGFENYYLVWIPFLIPIAYGMYYFFKISYLKQNYRTYSLPARNFAFTLIRAKGLGQQNTGGVYRSKIIGYKGQSKGNLKIQLVREEAEALQKERENIIREFNLRYPFVKLSIISNDSLSIEKIIEQRKKENKVIYI